MTTPPSERIHAAAPAAESSYVGGGDGAGPAKEAATAGCALNEDEIGGEGAAFADPPFHDDKTAPVKDAEVPSSFDMSDDADVNADEEEREGDE